MVNVIKEKVAAAEVVLVGIGEEFAAVKAGAAAALAAYQKLAELLGDKDYFVVTMNTDDFIYKSELKDDRIVAPCGSDAAGNVVTNENYDESGYMPQWQCYTKWLEKTLNRKLCILELGVGFQYPTVIRFPFEKVTYFNQKSEFIRVNSKFAQLTPEIKERSTAISESPVDILNRM